MAPASDAVKRYRGHIDGFRALVYTQDTVEVYQRRQFISAEQSLCTLGDQTQPAQIQISGDSASNTSAGAFDRWLMSEGRAAKFVFAHTCLLTVATGSRRRREFGDLLIGTMRASAEIKTAMLVALWRQPFERGLEFYGAWSPAVENRSEFADLLDETLAALLGTAERIVIVDPLYALPHYVAMTLARIATFGLSEPVDRSVGDYRADYAETSAVFDGIDREDVSRITLTREFCADGTCPENLARRASVFR